jgi:hypothetical protein
MKKSKLFSINYRDLFKGLLTTVGTTIFTTIATVVTAGQLFKKEGWTIIGMAAGGSFFGYLGKNFFTNSKDEFATKETLPQL